MLEAVYLVVINTALYLPLTQELVNGVRPDKFRVTWERAWSWFPVRVHVRGLHVDGASRSQQWQLETPSAAASISLLPLVAKRVWVSGVQATDVDYRQRPRLKPDKNYSALLPFFPEIGAREVAPLGEANTAKKSPWHIAVDGIEATGTHNFWIFQMRGSAEGSLSGDLAVETRGGPFSLDLTSLDLALSPVSLSGDHEVLSGGTLSGDLGFTPFVPRDNKGVAMLSYLYTDVQADLSLNDLSFLDLFLLKLKSVAVNGKGQVKGQLRLDSGAVLPGTHFEVDARELQVSAFSHLVGGEGRVTLAMDDEQLGEGLYLGFLYEGLTVTSPEGRDDLLTGEGLGLAVRGNGQLLPDDDQPDTLNAIEMTINALSVPELAQLQNYLPPQVPVLIHGGQGTLDGKAHIGATSLSVDVTLDSDNADLSIRDYRFNTNLDVAIRLDNPDVMTRGTSVGGSYFALSDSRVQRGENEASGQWNTRFDIEQGEVSLNGNPAERGTENIGDLFRDLGGADASDRLSRLWAQLDLSASMSSLEWIAALIEPGHGIGVGGSGQMRGKLHIDDGKAEPPSKLAVISDDLSVRLLDYVSRGSGEIGLVVEKGHPEPLWLLDIALRDADLKRQSDEVSHIEDVELLLAAQMTPSDDEEKPLQATELDFRIPSARVSDMAAFNSYLPRDGSVIFAGGTAELTADIQLRQRDAGGWLKLNSTGAKAVVAEQSVSGDLLLDVQLAGGIPQDMAFDISGSKVQLDNVQVAGERSEFDDTHWSATFTLERGQAIWRKPVRVRAEGLLAISDTRPFVTMFENGGWRPAFLSRMLTIEDIEGQASLSMADEVLYIEDASILSDKLEMGARGSLSAEGRDAMLYLRYKRLDGVLKYKGQDRNLDIVNARETFDAFQPKFPTIPGGD